ncbi:KAT8 regulatory NSL complex subunit 1-like protein [Brienomyrus brachyistius]|uniref:KAT8 regulatory NSL complex subunit 1-like protein n=1 Tax=Brienomyrus brachyistius TaxID=42636 RepID=UPI0020B3393E|nr:KAT8 regulatory NSL complex subunit 1-like protein [Brienomyrus brachyistius]
MSPALPESFTLKPSGEKRSWLHRSGATAPAAKEKLSQLQPSGLRTEQQVWDRRVHCVSQHWSLVRRATLMQRRVRTLLGEHTIQHFVRQLDTLRERCLEKDALPASPGPLPQESSFPGIAEAGLTHARQGQDASRDIQRLASRIQVVMKEAQLDSDATESSSDEEPDRDVTPGPQGAQVRGGREWRWQNKRAEIGSRWAWLQVRLAELGAQIQMLDNFHRRIVSNKGRVVLAGPWSSAGNMGQQACSLQTGPSSAHPCCSNDSASDPEAEPSSPTRLLRNIERQSAQLAQIVSRLREPLCSAPLTVPEPTLPSKGTDRSKQVHLTTRQSRCRKSSQSARTRPLLTYHKRRLFTFDSRCPGMQQPRLSMSLLPAQEPSLACPLCEFCCPIAVSTEPHCSREAPVGVDEIKWAELMRPHPVLSLSSETPLSLYLQSAFCRDARVQQPALVRIERSSPCFLPPSRDAVFRTPPMLVFSSNPKRQTFHREGSPFTRRGRRKRIHSNRSSEGRERGCQSYADHFSNPSTGTEDSPEGVMVPQGTLTQQRWGGLGQRGGLSIDIDDVIIPISLATATKRKELQQKHIITPSWRVIEIGPLDAGEEAPVELEAVSDKVFACRHLPYEAAERLRWYGWKCGRGRRRTDSPAWSGKAQSEPSAQSDR